MKSVLTLLMLIIISLTIGCKKEVENSQEPGGSTNTVNSSDLLNTWKLIEATEDGQDLIHFDLQPSDVDCDNGNNVIVGGQTADATTYMTLLNNQTSNYNSEVDYHQVDLISSASSCQSIYIDSTSTANYDGIWQLNNNEDSLYLENLNGSNSGANSGFWYKIMTFNNLNLILRNESQSGAITILNFLKQ